MTVPASHAHDPNAALYSEAYDRGVAGLPCPDTSHLVGEAKAATEYGYERGVRIQREVSHANRNDPSADYLTRSTVASMKWRFPPPQQGL